MWIMATGAIFLNRRMPIFVFIYLGNQGLMALVTQFTAPSQQILFIVSSMGIMAGVAFTFCNNKVDTLCIFGNYAVMAGITYGVVTCG